MSYVLNIANSIIFHTRDAEFLGPEMYTAIAEWEKNRIPPAIVLNSIEEVYERSGMICGSNIPVEIFEDVVNRNFQRWLASGSEANGKGA